MRLSTKKMAVTGMLTAAAVVMSAFYIPIGAAKCFPVQHLCNIIAGVFLGPIYGVSMAFCTSLIRNMMGTGSLLAFPGSMAGALLCALLYKYTGRLAAAYGGEVFGTGIIGGLLCWPVAVLLMGKEAAVFAYVLPFLMSTACGAVMAVVLMGALTKSGAFSHINRMLENDGHSEVRQ